MKMIFIRNNKIVGILLCFLLAVGSYVLVDPINKNIFRFSENSISPIIFATLLGLILRHLFNYFSFFDEGYQFCINNVLKFGIILLGVRLSILQLMNVSVSSVFVIFPCIIITIIFVLNMSRYLKISKNLSILIAVGTSICGASAIASVAPLINAKKEEMSYAIANIALFGVLGMLLYPFLAHFIFSGNSFAVGLFLGSAIHDTSQVTGAAMIYDKVFISLETLKIATITKLIRNTAMIIVIPVIAMKSNNLNYSKNKIGNFIQFFPLFILGFIFFVFARSIGDFFFIENEYRLGILNADNWMNLISNLSFLSNFLLVTSMAAIGLSTDLKILKKMGLKIFYFGFIVSCFVGLISITIIKIFII